MLSYQPHGGRLHERRIIAESLRSTLGRVEPERLLVTSGGQHGLAITAIGLLRRGDIVAVDALTYPGFKSVVALQVMDLTSIKGDQGIMDPDGLDRQRRLRPIKAVYLMPTVHNPLGSVMGKRNHVTFRRPRATQQHHNDNAGSKPLFSAFLPSPIQTQSHLASTFQR